MVRRTSSSSRWRTGSRYGWQSWRCVRMSKPIIIRGGRVIDPRNRVDAVRDVRLEGGKVAAVSEKPLPLDGAEEIQAHGLWVTPGFIDLHVHLREPGEEGKETILTGDARRGGGRLHRRRGDAQHPAGQRLGAGDALVRQRAAEADLARVYPVGAITKGLQGEEMAELGALRDAGCVAVTDDGRPVMSASLMRRALMYSAPLGLPVMVHEEDLTLSAGGALTEGPRATRLGLLPIPRSAEVVMVARDLVLLEEVGGRLHVAHLSCAASVAPGPRGEAAGPARHRRGRPAPLHPHRRGGGGLRHPRQDEPAAPASGGRGRRPGGPRRRHHRRHRHRPRAPRRHGQAGAVRRGRQRSHRAGDGAPPHPGAGAGGGARSGPGGGAPHLGPGRGLRASRRTPRARRAGRRDARGPRGRVDGRGGEVPVQEPEHSLRGQEGHRAGGADRGGGPDGRGLSRRDDDEASHPGSRRTGRPSRARRSAPPGRRWARWSSTPR